MSRTGYIVGAFAALSLGLAVLYAAHTRQQRFNDALAASVSAVSTTDEARAQAQQTQHTADDWARFDAQQSAVGQTVGAVGELVAAVAAVL